MTASLNDIRVFHNFRLITAHNVMFLHLSVILFTGVGVVCLWSRGTTPWADTPTGQTPPGKHPLGRHPLDQDPPGRHPFAQCMLGYMPRCPVHAGIHPSCPVHAGIPPSPRADTPLGADTPQSRHPLGSRLQHTVYERPVRILLECILVISMNLTK